jgi:hypothetical protein
MLQALTARKNWRSSTGNSSAVKLYDGGHSVSVNGGPDSAGSSPVGKVTIYDEGATVEVISGPPPGPQPEPSPERYRSDQRYLFQHVRSQVEPDRIHKGDSGPWIQDGKNTQGQLRVQPVGGRSTQPNEPDHIDFFVGWHFDSKGKGGDIIDRLLKRNPATPAHWLTRPLNSVTAGSFNYTIDATAALKFIQANDRWNAWSFNRTGALRAMAGKASANPPRFDVIYTDGSSESLPCRITALMTGATAYPFTILNQSTPGLPQFDLPIVAEFERPTKPVASAILAFTIATHSATASTFTGNILDPPLNTNPVQLGVAQQAGPLDDGLITVPSIINAHQYLDSQPDSDFFDWSGPQNTDDEKNFSPEIIWPEHTGNPVPGPYVPDLTKIPHRTSPVGGKHKWMGMTAAAAATQFHKVPSTWPHEGFEPLAPGVGALRESIPALPGITDGTIEQSASWQTVLAHIFLPADKLGADDIYTRYYIRLGCPTRLGQNPLGPPDVPFRTKIEERFQVFNSSGHWIFSDMHGKTGISPYGGTGQGAFSGTAGGGGGTQFRLSFGAMTSADDGPDVGGLALGWHLYDFAQFNPPGFQYNGDNGNLTQFGQLGGLGGIIYGGHWYCLETRVKLNKVRDSSGNIIPALPDNNMRGGYLPDGELWAWIDGRLVFLRKGMVFRSLPYTYLPHSANYDLRNLKDPGYNKSYRRQCRDIGHISMMLNHYHGGVTQSPINWTTFYALLAYGSQYIGPARLN